MHCYDLISFLAKLVKLYVKLYTKYIQGHSDNLFGYQLNKILLLSWQ